MEHYIGGSNLPFSPSLPPFSPLSFSPSFPLVADVDDLTSIARRTLLLAVLLSLHPLLLSGHEAAQQRREGQPGDAPEGVAVGGNVHAAISHYSGDGRSIKRGRYSWGGHTSTNNNSKPVVRGKKLLVPKNSGILQREPRNGAAYKHLSTALRFAGRFEECAAVIMRGVDMSPEFGSPHTLTLLGNTLRLIGRHSDAVPYYRRAISLDPSYPKAYLQLAMTIQTSPSSSADDRRTVPGLYLTAIRLSSVERDDAWIEASLLLITSDLRSDLGSTTRSRAISRYISLVGMTSAAFRRSSRLLALPLPSNLLPPPPPLQSELSVHESARRRLRGEWDALQGIGGGGGCGVGRRFVVFRFGSNIFGLGAQMHYFSLVASYAYDTNRTIIAAESDEWWYVSEKDCPSRSWSCYLEPMSPLSDCPYFPPNLPHITGDAAKDEGARALATSDDTEALLIQMGYRAYVPQDFQDLGLLWWRSQVLSRFFVPSKVVMDSLEAAASLLSWPNMDQKSIYGGVVGVHVRHGDKVQEEAPYIPLTAYADAVQQVLDARHDIKLVYLATDSPSVIASMRKAMGSTQVMVLEEEERSANLAYSLVRDTHNLNTTRYAHDAFVNALLLQRCDAFVGTLSSNFGRMAVELMHGATSAPPYPPTISLDFPWYADP